ncbi:6-phosphogluconolactonase [Jongsikchunia kroppenstedtii]|uniref:6-phosphogluconolactonase n=1 Tax=Jongsikchunia kroppenstedtii TaxID=1121721 RepID=UPI000360D040|nr:6-phosphogluconolactonase [Jongsikchunia kroppenstedtii]
MSDDESIDDDLQPPFPPDPAYDTIEVRLYDSSAELVESAAAEFIDVIGAAQRERGVARVVLTGGSNGIAILRALRESASDLDWSNIEFYWGDDRFVPAADPDRNSGQAHEALLDHVPVDPTKVHVMAPSDGEFGDDIDAAAAAYEAIIDGVDTFDLHLLGMGGEGHINSLFPHTAATAESMRTVVAVTDSPKPPPRRITLTFPAINRARQVWFLVAGADKAQAVAAGVGGADRTEWPCAGAVGTEATVWFVDDDAAPELM